MRLLGFVPTCPELPLSSFDSTLKLLYFIAYALHCAKLHPQ